MSNIKKRHNFHHKEGWGEAAEDHDHFQPKNHWTYNHTTVSCLERVVLVQTTRTLGLIGHQKSTS